MRKGEMDSGESNYYISGIDGLRAIAVIMVLAYHLKLPFAKGGLLGVTVFFVISGFCLPKPVQMYFQLFSAITTGGRYSITSLILKMRVRLLL